jgi:ubiquitin C-terminal hydrolase
MKLVTFPNLGNTCYLNSILQCFINNPHFQNIIKNKTDKNEFLIELETIIKLIDLTVNDETVSIKYNLTNFIQIKNNFRLFQQHDAHEYLMYFLDKVIPDTPDYHGTLKTSMHCGNCKNISIVYEQFNTINLDPNGNCSIYNLFMDYLKKESISEYYCEKCNTSSESTKKLSIHKLPTNLIIVLKKYNNKFKIQYPLNDLKIKESSSGIINNYSLTAVVNHLGNLNNGHYNCNVLVNDAWYFIDDETIYLNTSFKTDEPNVYILFFKK